MHRCRIHTPYARGHTHTYTRARAHTHSHTHTLTLTHNTRACASGTIDRRMYLLLMDPRWLPIFPISTTSSHPHYHYHLPPHFHHPISHRNFTLANEENIKYDDDSNACARARRVCVRVCVCVCVCVFVCVCVCVCGVRSRAKAKLELENEQIASITMNVYHYVGRLCCVHWLFIQNPQPQKRSLLSKYRHTSRCLWLQQSLVCDLYLLSEVGLLPSKWFILVTCGRSAFHC